MASNLLKGRRMKTTSLLLLLTLTAACDPTRHDGKCDEIALGTTASTLPLGGRPNALLYPSKGTAGLCTNDAGMLAVADACAVAVGAPYGGGTCIDRTGEGGTYYCGVWVDAEGKVIGVGSTCYN